MFGGVRTLGPIVMSALGSLGLDLATKKATWAKSACEGFHWRRHPKKEVRHLHSGGKPKCEETRSGIRSHPNPVRVGTARGPRSRCSRAVMLSVSAVVLRAEDAGGGTGGDHSFLLKGRTDGWVPS